MLILIPIGLLLLASLAIYILDLSRPKFGVSWLIASVASILAWLTVLFSRLRLPTTLPLQSWNSADLRLTGHLSLLLDYDSWPYVLALLTVALAVILSDAARTRYDSTPRAWSLSLMITAFGLLAIQAGTSLMMMMAWVLLDLLEVFHLLRKQVTSTLMQKTDKFNPRVIVSYGVRTASIMFLFLATIQGWSAVGDFDLRQIPTNAGFIFLLAAGLRLGVFPLNMPLFSEYSDSKRPTLRRGVGNIIRLTPAAASLGLLARLPTDLVTSDLERWMPLFMGLLALAVLYGAVRWLSAADEIQGRPYWIIAWASFAAASVLNGAPQASIAWGLVMILPGSLLFLYFPRIQRINFLLLFGLIGLLGLPFTPAASGWVGLVANGFNIWTIIFIIAHGLMVLGYLDRALQPGGMPAVLESWARVVFPLSLIFVIQTMIVLGWIGWPGAFTLGVWWLSLISNVLILTIVILIHRFGARSPYFQLPASSGIRKTMDWLLPRLEPIFRLEWLYQVAWRVYNFLGRIMKVLSVILEGEGGILWTILILVLLITILTGGGIN